jgi:RNA polymerase sigma-70 factor, ECF subfamily
VGNIQDNLVDSLPSVFRFAHQLCRDNHWAEDIAQEAILRAIRARVPTSDVTTLRVWLFRVARNLFIDGYRKNTKHSVLSLETCQEPTGHSVDTMEVNEELRIVTQLIAELPDRQRTVLHLIVYEEMNAFDVASILGITPEAVRSSLSMARIQLRKRFQQSSTP